MASRRSAIAVSEGVFFELPPARPLRLRDAPACAVGLSRSDNTSAHYVAHRLHLRSSNATARCRTCGAPTNASDVWRALTALQCFVLQQASPAPTTAGAEAGAVGATNGNSGGSASVSLPPGLYASRCVPSAGKDVLCFTVVDEYGNVERFGDGSDLLVPPDATWTHLGERISS